MLKTYRIFREKAKPVTVWVNNGQAVTPNFQQVGLFKDYSTRDKDIQAALENDTRFKSAYFLVYEEKDETEIEETKKTPNTTKTPKETKVETEQAEETTETTEQAKEEPMQYQPIEESVAETETAETEQTAETPEIQENSVIVCEAATSAAAKAFLREKGITISKFVPVAEVIEIGKANGIIFPNLVVNG